MSDEQAVLLEPAAVGVHAVLRALPHPGERVLIIGAGTIGLLTLQAVRALAPQAEVSVLARHPFQIEQATRLGAAHIIYPQDSYTGIQRATGAQLYQSAFGNRVLLGGYDVIYDSVGSQKTLHHALRWARTQGTVVLVGLNLHMMHLDLTPVWYQEVNLLGSMGSGVEIWPPGSSEQRTTFDITAELMKRGLLQPEHLITHRFPLNNYQAAIKTATEKAQSRAIKVVFDYSLLPASVVPNIRASAARKRRATPPPAILPPSEEQTPTEVSFPIEALALSTPIEPEPAGPSVASPVVSPPPRTPVVALSEEEELSMMEDTLKSPAITPRIEPVDTHEAFEESYADIPIVETMPTTIADDEPPATVEKLSPAITQASEEPSATVEESLPATTQAIEEPPPASAQTTEESLKLHSAPAIEPVDDNSVAPQVEEIQSVSELLETGAAPDVEYVPDESEQAADAALNFSESFAPDPQDDWSDFPESTEIYQEEPPDFIEKDESREIDESSATGESDRALLHIEKPANIQVQARPRTRKKNSRTAQRGKK